MHSLAMYLPFNNSLTQSAYAGRKAQLSKPYFDSRAQALDTEIATYMESKQVAKMNQMTN